AVSGGRPEGQGGCQGSKSVRGFHSGLLTWLDELATLMNRVPFFVTAMKPIGRASPLIRKPSICGAPAAGGGIAPPVKLTSTIRIGIKVTDPALIGSPTTVLT